MTGDRRAAGRQILAVPESPSTNAELRERAHEAEAWPHLSVLFTRNQTAGRGRLDRQWTAPPGTGLAVSVLLRELPAPALRGWISLAAGLATADAISTQLPHHDVGVKWPNDVLVDDHKISGVLAEATAEVVIVGIGINTAMSAEHLPVPTATSFAALGAEADEDRLVDDIVTGLDALVELLKTAGHAPVRDRIAARCLTLGRRVQAQLPGGAVIQGAAESLDDDGRLVIVADDGRHPVAAGDIVHLRPAD